MCVFAGFQTVFCSGVLGTWLTQTGERVLADLSAGAAVWCSFLSSHKGALFFLVRKTFYSIGDTHQLAKGGGHVYCPRKFWG